VNVALVIPAAGSGERLGRGVSKALVDVGGTALLRRTLDRLAAAADFVETIVLAPSHDIARFEAAVAGAGSSLGSVRILAGGATRQQSVAAGVAAVTSSMDVVCVHDAARPLVSARTVRAVVEAAFTGGAATAASRPSDSVRADIAGGNSVALDRSTLWLVETPQAFRREILERGHLEAVSRGNAFTDDASLVEAIGHPIHIVESEGRNLKITLAADLMLAAELLRAS